VGVFADPCLFELQVDLRAGEDPYRALDILDEELERVVSRGVDDEEMTTARNRNRLGFYLGLSAASGKAHQLGFFETVLGDCAALETRIERIGAAGADDVHRCAAETFRPEARTVLVATPEGA
jgi:predicted Zn-dependent peptidase